MVRGAVDRLVVIGDLNGHAHLLDRLLLGTGLMDPTGRWIGGRSVLVQMGDVVNRGAGARAAVDRLVHLQRAAREAGGDVVWLLGNHEVMTALGHEAYVTADEYMEFATPEAIEAFHVRRTRFLYELLGPPDLARRVEPIGGRMRAWEEDNAPGKEAFREAFSARGIYGRHLRTLPAAVRIGDLVLVHGGLHPSWARLGVEGIHAEVQAAWRAAPPAYQTLAPAGVLRDPLGPVWHRAYCISSAPTVERDAACALELLGARRMIVGHTRTETAGGVSGRPLLRQGDRVVMTDVGLGEPGEPGAALVVEEGRIDVWSPLEGRSVLAPR